MWFHYDHKVITFGLHSDYNMITTRLQYGYIMETPARKSTKSSVEDVA